MFLYCWYCTYCGSMQINLYSCVFAYHGKHIASECLSGLVGTVCTVCSVYFLIISQSAYTYWQRYGKK